MAYWHKSETTASNSLVILDDWGTTCTYYIGGDEEYRKAESAIENELEELVAEDKVECDKRDAAPMVFAAIESDGEFSNDHKSKPRQLESTYG